MSGKAPTPANLFKSVDEFTAMVQQYVYHTDLDDATKAQVKDAVVAAHTAIRLLRIERQVVPKK